MTTLSTIIVPSGILTNSDIGTSVQAYDADTTKNDVANTFTANQTIEGNLNFSGDARRITGDFSTTTFNNRTYFQSSVTDGNTYVYSAPNGTATNAGFFGANASDVTNSSLVQLYATATDCKLGSAALGTGTVLPLTFNVNGEKMRIDTSGNVGIGTASPNSKFAIVGDNTQPNIFTSNSDKDIGYSGPFQIGEWNGTTYTERMRITTSGGISFGSSGTAYGTSGQVLKSNGDAVPTWIDNISSVNTLFLTSGTTYTVPSNLLYAQVIVVGAGGGGGAGDCTDSAASNAGGGGGAGGTVIKFYTKAEIGTSATYAIGAGGAGGPGGGAGSGATGGTSTFTANGTYTTTLSAPGGTGGVGVSSGATSNSAKGGTGGTGTGGDFNITGADGNSGISYSSDSIAGNGGGSYFGGGGAGGLVNNNSVQAGAAASTKGAGGGGGASRNNTGTANGGGSGADGVVFITEYLE